MGSAATPPCETVGPPAVDVLLARYEALAPDDLAGRLAIGAELRGLGAHDAALTVYADLAARDPADTASLIHMAACHAALGKLLAAFADVQAAIDRAPRQLGVKLLEAVMPTLARQMQDQPAQLAACWIAIGLRHYRHGDVGFSKNALQTALRIVPDHPEATAHLGAITRLGGDAPAAEALLRAFIARVPDAIEPRLALAEALQRESRLAEGAALLNVAAAADPHLRQRHLLLAASIMLGLREVAQARALLGKIREPLPDLLPFLQWRRLMLTLGTGDIEAAKAEALAITPLETILVDSPLLTEQRVMLLYDLSRFWQDRGDRDRTFEYWHRAHAMVAQLQPFPREVVGGFVDATINAFTADKLRNQNTGLGDSTPVFVVGMPRSGTTLIEQILDAHPLLHGAGERTNLGELFLAMGGARETAKAAERIASLTPDHLTPLATDYLRHLHQTAPDARHVIDKMPGNWRYLGFASLMMPGARIIHCVRDPRDIGLSVYSFRFHGHHPYAHDLGDLGWYIAQHDKLMAHWKAVLPNPILTVQLRDWVEDFDGTLRRVLRFLDVPYDPACERFHESTRAVRTVSKDQVRQPVNARGLNRWQPYAKYLAPLMRELGLPESDG